MGLSDAIRMRLALARGERLGEAIRIFLAPRAERRRIAARKFPGQAVPTGVHGRAAAATEPAVTPEAILDAAWYAAAHGLPDPEASAGHFRTRGLAAGLAPRATLAGRDGRHLSPQGAAFLHRLGLALGSSPTGRPAADALDPWTIGNPRGRPVAVVTAATSQADRLPPIASDWAESADFYVLTPFAFDEPGPWRVVQPVFHHPDAAQVAVFAKTHLGVFFAAYDRVLWIDPGILLCADPAEVAASASGPFACFRSDDHTTPLGEAAALAASGRLAPDAAADAAGGLADGGASPLPDPAVLLLDPSDASARALLTAWWRHAMRLPAADRLALALALAEMPDVRRADLPGGTLAASPAFARRGPP